MVEPPDYLFADSLLAALIEAGAFGVPGITFERERNRYRAERYKAGRRVFVGYFPPTGTGLTQAIEEVRRVSS